MKIMQFKVLLSVLLVSVCRAAPLDSETHESSVVGRIHESPAPLGSARSDRSNNAALSEGTFIKVEIISGEEPSVITRHSKRSPHHGGDHSEDEVGQPQSSSQSISSTTQEGVIANVPSDTSPTTSHIRDRRDGYGYGGSSSGVKAAPYTAGSLSGESYDSSGSTGGCGPGSGCGVGPGKGSGRRQGHGRGRGSGFASGGTGFGSSGPGFGSGGSGLSGPGGSAGYGASGKGSPAIGGGYGSSGIAHDSSAHGSSGSSLSEPYSDGYGSSAQGSPSFAGSNSGGSPLLASGHGAPGFGGPSANGSPHGTSGFGSSSQNSGFGGLLGANGNGNTQGSPGYDESSYGSSASREPDGESFAFQGPNASGSSHGSSSSGSHGSSGVKGGGSSYKAPIRSGY